MQRLIKALEAKGAKELADEILVIVEVQEADVLPDTPEKLEKLKAFLRAVRRLQGDSVSTTVKTSLKNVFSTKVLTAKVDESVERFKVGALTAQGFCYEVYWHVKHQLHWIITRYEYDPTKFPADLDIPMLRGIISSF